MDTLSLGGANGYLVKINLTPPVNKAKKGKTNLNPITFMPEEDSGI